MGNLLCRPDPSLADKRWYHGGITHRQAINRLEYASHSNPNGTYLVYDDNPREGKYWLCVYHNGGSHRCRITRTRSGDGYVLGRESRRPGVHTRVHSTVRRLIKYHRGLTGRPITLDRGGQVILSHRYVYIDHYMDQDDG